jgi:hypothetical protein
MRSSRWLAGALAGPLLVGAGFGCASSGVRQDQAMLGRLTIDDKQEVFTAEHNVEVAQANGSSAERALDEAKSFREVADRELDAAKDRLEASRKAIEMGRKAGGGGIARNARASADLDAKQVVASRAKKDYADRMVDLRQHEVALADQQLDEARIEEELARVNVLRANGLTPREDVAAILRERQNKLADIADEEQRVARMRGDVEQLRIAWAERRHRFDVASRDTTIGPITPPGAPSKIAPEPLPEEVVPPASNELLTPRF